MLLHYLLTHDKLRSINPKTISESWNVLRILLNTIMTVLVYCCCSKKLPQNCWLKGTIFFSYCSVDRKFRFWGVEIEVSADASGESTGELVPCLFQLLLADDIRCLCSHHPCFHWPVSYFLFYSQMSLYPCFKDTCDYI